MSERAKREKGNDYQKPYDSVEWFRDDTNDMEDKNDPKLNAIMQLLIGALSVNTTSQLLTNSIFNLANWPEYVPALRQEIDDTLREAGGKWTTESMAQLEKMDSFVKETLRHSGHLTSKLHSNLTGLRMFCFANRSSHLPTDSAENCPCFGRYGNSPGLHGILASERHQL